MAANLYEHLSQVSHEEAPCADTHADDFAELFATYHTDEDLLADALTKDITPERIFIGGDLIPAGTIIIDSDEGDDPYVSPYATLERWAADDDTVVRVSKRNTVSPRLASAQQAGNWASMPRIGERRTQKIIAAIMTASNMSIEEFDRPDEITDKTLQAMRQAAEHPTYGSRNQEAAIKTRNRLHTDYDYMKQGMLPEVIVKVPESEVELFSFFGMPKRLREAMSQEERDGRLQHNREFLIHYKGLELLTATEGLGRAANIVRNGQLIVPSQPQDELHRWAENF